MFSFKMRKRVEAASASEPNCKQTASKLEANYKLTTSKAGSGSKFVNFRLGQKVVLIVLIQKEEARGGSKRLHS